MGAVGDANRLPCPFRISFGFRNGDHQAFLGQADLLVAQRDQLAAPEGAGETDQQSAIAPCP